MLPDNIKLERRKNKRFQTPPGTFAVLSIHPRCTKLAEIIDISRSGLAFRHIGEANQPKKTFQMGIAFKKYHFYMNKVPYKIISDLEIQRYSNRNKFGKTRRCGIQFTCLTHDQKFDLENFIRNYTTGEVKA